MSTTVRSPVKIEKAAPTAFLLTIEQAMDAPHYKDQ
jgi:hypothetical protein